MVEVVSREISEYVCCVDRYETFSTRDTLVGKGRDTVLKMDPGPLRSDTSL